MAAADPMLGSRTAPSLPLYLAGLVITLCGVLAANAALSVPDYTWMLDTVLLTGLGFLFSFGSRRLGISSRFVDFGFVALALLLLAAVGAGQFALGAISAGRGGPGRSASAGDAGLGRHALDVGFAKRCPGHADDGSGHGGAGAGGGSRPEQRRFWSASASLF